MSRLLADDAEYVVIEKDGEGPVRYRVVGVVESGSRDREYQLRRVDDPVPGRVHRVCHAPWANLSRPKSAYTNSSRITYEWPAKGFRY